MGSTHSTPARILIVEDDPDMHDLVVKLALRSGHEPVSAHTGEQALSVLRDEGEKVDWLLTDIRLSGRIDGWVVGSEFTLKHPLRPVIYMSGIEEDCAGRRAVGSVFLRKPVNVSDLMAAFARLANYKDRAALARRTDTLSSRPTHAPSNPAERP